MDGYDPSATGILKEKLRRAFLLARQRLPVWRSLAEPRDPVQVLEPKQLEILRLYGTGRTPEEIAFRLFISIQSSNMQLSIIARKLHVRRGDLARLAAEHVRATGWRPL